MLSPDRRQEIEREAVREIHRFHRDIKATTFSSVIDDIRHKVLEEGMYGRQVTGDIGHAYYSMDASHEQSAESSNYRAIYGEAPVSLGDAAHGTSTTQDPLRRTLEPDSPSQQPRPYEAGM